MASLTDVCITTALAICRKTVDDSQKVNAENAARSGLEVRVTRTYDNVGLSNKRICMWCVSRCGVNMTLEEARYKGAFQRHEGCGCEIEYKTQKGIWQRQTNWEHNEWENVIEESLPKIRKLKREERVDFETKRIVRKYLKKATPGHGEYTMDLGFNKSKYPNEVKYADILYNTFGGNIRLLKRLNDKRRSDYQWNGRYWEHKAVSSLTAVDSQVYSALGQIKDNPGGIVLQMTSNFDVVEAQRRIIHRLDRSAKTYGVNKADVLMFDGEDLVLAVEWKKNRRP